MCVIVVKPAGVGISEKVLERCARTNKDLCGYAIINEDKTVYLEKGFRTAKDLIRSLPLDWQDLDVAFHFRIATHGFINIANAHPFPITGSDKFLKADAVRSPTMLMHNGVVPVLKVTSKDDQKRFSDTYLFVRDVLSKFPPEMYGTILQRYVGQGMNRFLIAKDGKFEFFGKWFEMDGCFFSNMYWQPWSESVVETQDDMKELL